MEEYPEKQKSDYVHSSAKAALSVIPIVGGAVSTLYETLLSAPIDKRKKEWLVQLAETVEALCEKVDDLTPESLAQNEEFISICIQASNIALRTHQEEKLTILRTVVANSVLEADVDESKKMIFLRVVDEMTVLHLRVYRFLSEIKWYVGELNKKLPNNQFVDWRDARNVWDETFSDIKSGDAMLDVIVRDLKRYGFVFISEFREARLDPVSTSFGREFSKFINERS